MELVVLETDGSKRIVPLGGELVLGRDPGCDVVLESSGISRKHARIFPANGTWVIQDLRSLRGTKVNGMAVTEKPICAGDRITLGKTVIEVAENGAHVGEISPPAGMTTRPATALESTPAEMTPSSSPNVTQQRRVDEANLVRKTLAASRLDLRDSGSGAEDAMMALLRIGQGLHRCVDVDSVCRVALEMAVRIFGADRGVIALANAAGECVPRAELAADGRTAAPLTISRTFVDRIVGEKTAMLVMDAGQDSALKAARSVAALDIHSLVGVPLLEGETILGYFYLDRIGGVASFGSRDLELLCVVGYQAAAEIARLNHLEAERREQEQRRSLQRFFSSEVIRHLEEDARAGHDRTTSTHARTVTVLFSDIQGFTSISEKLDPSVLKRFLDIYFDRMTEILVDHHGGTLDKYIGDAIMGLFGAPYSRGEKEDATAAVAAAVEMRDAVAELGKELPHELTLAVRVGVNTGSVIAGMMGSKRRLEYSVVGDAVNVASRLESTGEPGRIQIGEGTWEKVNDAFVCESAGERHVKNRAQPVRCWWVTGRK